MQNYGEEETEPKKASVRAVFHLLHHPMATMSRARPSISQVSGAPSRSPAWLEGPKSLAILHCFLRHINRVLNQKWSR